MERKKKEENQTGKDVERWRITIRVRDREIQFKSEPEYSYTKQKAISLQTASENPGTPPQPRVTAPLILLTLLVFHPHRLAGSIHTSITLQSFCFLLPYAKGVGSSGGFRDGWINRSPDSGTSSAQGTDCNDQPALADQLCL